MRRYTKRYLLGSAALLMGLSTATLQADITGKVYKDFDSDGTFSSGDAPVIGIPVKATCTDGNTYTDTTDSNGNYTLSGFPTGSKCRVEADPSSQGVGSGTNAPGSAPLVDIVADGSVHNISTGSSATYCQANPDVVMAALPGYFTSGQYGTGGGTSPLGHNFGSVFKVPAPQNGTFNNNGTIGSKRTTLAIIDQTGAIWGVAWQKSTKALFVAAALKRYVPLKDESTPAAAMTSAGTIYKVDTTASPATVTPFTVVPNALSTTAASEMASRVYDYNNDINTRKYTGRMGLGDLDISEDDTKLYTVNMNTKELVVIDAQNGNILSSLPIPNPYANGECSDAKVRPWALKVRGQDVYIGSVCEDQVENDVGAAIQKYNGAIFQTVAKTNSLRYYRPPTYGPANSNSAGKGYRYRNWTNDTADAPMLTDIEFTNSGDLVLGYNSRATYNRSGSLRGDIRKMCLQPDGSYVDEIASVDPDVPSSICVPHTQQYGSNPDVFYEFYIGDYFGSNGHPDTASGALAQAPGAPNIIVGMIDGTDWWQPGAIGNYDNVSGDKIGAQAVINRNTISQGGEREPYGAKAGGMGDVELLCDPAPIEIGNYVWMDIDGDGIQDPNEPPMAGVPVTLTCGGTTFGTATTDANGHYYFGGAGNVNLTGSNVLTTGLSCELSIPQSAVNNKPPTQKDVNGNADDTIDNDADAVGSNNVITFTTTTANDHSLDFGIQPALGCVSGQLFQDNNGNGIQDGTDTVAPAGIMVILTDAYGNNYTTQTDNSGQFTYSPIVVGNVTVKVDTTDTDIPDGAVWSTATTTVNVSEDTPPNCAATTFPYALPSPIDQDPKDNAVCADATSLTWDGSNKSTATVWQDMLTNDLTNVTTAGGTTVQVSMHIDNPDNKFYDTDTANTSGSGTSAAFGTPYLTLYLGNQANPGDGNWNSPGNCAAHGYDLESGQKSVLTVTFDQEVVLDNWRIRDVDSGDVRSGVSDWEWQDGIQVEGFDADGNPVAIETKIGSSGAGLIVDANNTVHTDASTYDAGSGNFATGSGTSASSTNGHIVLTSNFVPVKTIKITHLAGPDMPCQTRSALALSGFAVCVPLMIEGEVFNDDDGVAPSGTCATSDDKVDGNNIWAPEGEQLNACLLDSNGIVLDTQPVSDDTMVPGQYSFKKYIKPNTTYKVLITTNDCTPGIAAPTAQLPQGWHYEGEQIDPNTNSGHDGTPDGMIEVAVATSTVSDVDFAINKAPDAVGYTRPSQVNPNDNTQLPFDTSGATNGTYISDEEDGVPSTIRITSISGGQLYNGGTPLNVGDTVANFSDIKLDPDNGDVTASFEYVTEDKACRVSNPATFTAPFTTLNISGNLFLDMTRDDQVNGTGTPNSCDGTTPLYVNLVDSAGNVLSSTALVSDGSFAFHGSDGVNPNSDYTIVLSQTQGTVGSPAPSATLPSGCLNLDGENIESQNPGGTDGTNDGTIAVHVATSDVTDVNFAITPTVKIGDKVWIEDDNDGDATTGTITPVVGTTVTAVCGSQTFTDTTDTNGLYSIEVPANIGTCTLSVPTPPNSAPAAGSTDSDVSDTTSENDKTHNNSGTTVNVGTVDNLTLDFGFANVGSWSGQVTLDSDLDGAGDTPIANVTIKLYSDPNCDGNSADGTLFDTTQTASNGTYSFDNVPAGCYVAIEQQPSGLVNVSENEGGADNDIVSNPADNNQVAGRVNAGENDSRNDFVEKTLVGKITGKVTEVDDNGNHTPIPGVTLILLDNGGNEVARTTTDSNGNYVFHAMPGTYTIQEEQPHGYSNVSEDEGGADNDATHPLINTLKVVLGASEVDIKNDFVERKRVGADPYKPCYCGCNAKLAKVTAPDKATVYWRHTTNETGYNIYVNGQFVAFVAADTTSYKLSDLSSDTAYTVDVVAVGKGGSTLKQTINFKTPAVPVDNILPIIYGLML